MKLIEWEMCKLSEEACLLCQAKFKVELMEMISQLRITGIKGTFVFYNLACPSETCPFVITAVVLRTQRNPLSFKASQEAAYAVKKYLLAVNPPCNACGERKLGPAQLTISHPNFPAFWIVSYCLSCETRNSRIIWWVVVNPLDMMRSKLQRTVIPTDLVLDAHEALKRVQSVSDLFR